MRVPDWRLYARWSQAFALVISGMIIGAAIFMVLYQHNMNELLNDYDTMRHHNEELEVKIKDLQKYQNDQNLILSIQVDIEESTDEEELSDVVRNKIKEEVRKDLDIFKGKPVTMISDSDTSQVTRTLFGKKRLSNIMEKDYEAEIKTMVLVHGELTVRLIVRPWKSDV